jgi:hypothetical protein
LVLLTPKLFYSINQEKHSRSKGDDNISTFKHYCAQRYGKQTNNAKHLDPKKTRAQMTMDRFECGGELFITVNSNIFDAVHVRIIHKQSHTYYVGIGSKSVEGIIKEMQNLPPSLVSYFKL